MLESRDQQSGISTLAPSSPRARLQSLPPILRSRSQNPRSGYSKAPRGLSVLLRVTGIFTRIATSPSPPLRQCPSRYAIRAGRNLPDKEFRSVMLLPRSLERRGVRHFCEPPRIAARLGLYHHPRCRGVRHVVSEGIRREPSCARPTTDLPC